MRHVATFNTGSQWQHPKILILAIRVYYGKLGRKLKPFVPKFRPGAFARLTDMAENQVPANLKLIAGAYCIFQPRNRVILLRDG